MPFEEGRCRPGRLVWLVVRGRNEQKAENLAGAGVKKGSARGQRAGLLRREAF